MSPPRVGSRAQPLALLLMLAAALAPTPAAAADEAPAWDAQARSSLVEASLATAHALRLPASAFAAPPQLDVLLAFSQPVLRGEDDLLASLFVRPSDGAASWSGAWWVDSSAGVSPPRKVTIGAEGMFLLLDGGALATSDRVRVTFGFVGDDGATWTHALAPVPVLDAAPTTARPELAGAAATLAAHTDAPQVLLLSVWNLVAREATVGFSILDADGAILRDVTVGRCADGAGNATEAGCRATFLVEARGAHVATWHLDASGQRLVGARHALADLAHAPHVFGQDEAADDGATLALRLQASR